MNPSSKQRIPSRHSLTFLISVIGKSDGRELRTPESFNTGLPVSAGPEGKIRK